MLNSDWLIVVIFFLPIQALHCEFAEFLLLITPYIRMLDSDWLIAGSSRDLPWTHSCCKERKENNNNNNNKKRSKNNKSPNVVETHRVTCRTR
jgi:hypothetical protein